MKTVASLRVSTAQQDVRSQRLAILEYARHHDVRIDEFIEATASGQASDKRRRLDELMHILQRGDRLVVSELSRLGRSLGQIVAILDARAKADVAFVALKEHIRVEGTRDIQTKVMTTLFALFAEVERGLISERTREGLAQARASGKKLGRPKGALGVSRLDGKEDDIRRFLELGVSKTAIAKITGVSAAAGVDAHDAPTARQLLVDHTPEEPRGCTDATTCVQTSSLSRDRQQNAATVETQVANSVVGRMPAESCEPAATRNAMTPVGSNVTDEVFMARNSTIALLAVPLTGFSLSSSCIARMPNGVAA